jgi:predicted nicotinamide N-methyase
MKYANDETGLGERCVTTSDFQHAVLEKLGRLEAKMDMIVGNGQPGRMKLAEDRLVALEKNDLRRNVFMTES